MRLCDRPHDRQSEAGTASRATTAQISAVKTLEDSLALGDRDPGAVVADREPELVGPDSLNLEADETGVHGSVLDRVASQVAHRLSEPIGICV